jgi:hypothetical protein
MACEPLSDPLNSDRAGDGGAARATTIQPQRLPEVAKARTYEEKLEQAVLRPNSHFFRGTNGKIGHATPARPEAERIPPALFIVNGVDKGHDFDVNAVPDSTVLDLKLLYGRDALERYGERARGGVVILNTTDGQGQKQQ